MAFRGGSRPGRGSFSMRIQGVDIEPNFEPSEKYPKVAMPLQELPNKREKQLVAQFLELRADIKDGPLFTGSNSSKAKVVIDMEQSIDDGISRYTDRYKKKRKIGRSIDEHPYILSVFPAELYPAMGLKNGKSKKLAILKSKVGLDQDLALNIDGDTTKEDQLLKKLSSVAEDGDDKDKDKDEDEQAENDDESGAEDEEDDFEDDEDEDDDYNAEKYFDDGDEYGAGDDDDGEAAY